MKRADRIPVRGTTPTKIWVVAADAAHARIFETTRVNGDLHEFAVYSNPDARRSTSDLVSDRAGHLTNTSLGAGHSVEPHEWTRSHVARTFAKRVGQRLISARKAGAVDRIYLIAAPAFLGLLRRSLDTPTRRIVAGEVSKNVTPLEPGLARQLLPTRL
jgi:protein required for attachment to host cells